MVSVVVSIQMRKMFAEARKCSQTRDMLSRMFVNGRRIGTSERDLCSYEAA